MTYDAEIATNRWEKTSSHIPVGSIRKWLKFTWRKEKEGTYDPTLNYTYNTITAELVNSRKKVFKQCLLSAETEDNLTQPLLDLNDHGKSWSSLTFFEEQGHNIRWSLLGSYTEWCHLINCPCRNFSPTVQLRRGKVWLRRKLRLLHSYEPRNSFF